MSLIDEIQRRYNKRRAHFERQGKKNQFKITPRDISARSITYNDKIIKVGNFRKA